MPIPLPAPFRLWFTFCLALFGSAWLLSGLLTRGGGLENEWLQLAWQWFNIPTAAAGIALLTDNLVDTVGWNAPEKSDEFNAAWFLAGAIWLAYTMLSISA